jgi:hypothetical protein
VRRVFSLILSYLSVPEAVSHVAKLPGREADRSPILVKDFKTIWMHTADSVIVEWN